VKSDSSILTLPSQSNITIAANTLIPGQYSFTVTVTKGSRSATFTVTIQVVAATTTIVNVGIRASATLIRTNDLILLTPIVASSVQVASYQWVLINVPLLSTTDSVVSTLTGSTLLINPLRRYLFIEGSVLVFELTITDVNGNRGKAQISITVATSPTGCKLEISPSTGGVALNTKFTISVLGCSSSLTPLSYVVRGASILTGLALSSPLVSASTNVLTTPLPAGNPVYVHVTVIDTFGSSSVVQSSIQVVSANLTTTQFGENINSTLNNFNLNKDTDGFVSQALSILSQLQGLSSTDQTSVSNQLIQSALNVIAAGGDRGAVLNLIAELLSPLSNNPDIPSTTPNLQESYLTQTITAISQQLSSASKFPSIFFFFFFFV